MSEQLKQNEGHDPAHGTLSTYIAGFLLSIVLTLVAYGLVVNQAFSTPKILVAVIVGLAVVQFVVQMVFFLHLGRETRPRWNLVVFSFMLMVLFILVLGTLWIMDNLDYHQMPAKDLEKHIVEDEGY